MTEAPKYYSLEEVAQILRISERTVTREIRAGKIRAFKAGRALRFTPEAVQEYIKNQEVKPEDVSDEDEPEAA
jgi:excisionase family DNA binding protein